MSQDPHNRDDIPMPILRPASPAETQRARRQLHASEARHAWEQEQRLTTLLHHLPDQPVPEDFTRRVLRSLDAVRWRPSIWRDWLAAWSRPGAWAPRLTSAAALVALVAAVWLHQQASARAQLAASVASITRPVHQAGQLADLPPVELLQDFEAIDQMRQLSSLADQELLTILAQAEP